MALTKKILNIAKILKQIEKIFTQFALNALLHGTFINLEP